MRGVAAGIAIVAIVCFAGAYFTRDIGAFVGGVIGAALAVGLLVQK